MSMPVRRRFLSFAAIVASTFVVPASRLGAQTPGPAETGKTSAKDALSPKENRRREAIEHYLRSRLYAQESEFELAVREFKKAVELEPSDGGLRREYGELLRDLPVYPEAEREARKAVELSPASAGAHRLLGQILLATAKDNSRLEEAARELKTANELAPGDPQGAVAYAQVLLRLEKPKEASSVLEGVLDRANGPAVLLLYGETLERSGQLQQAEDVYVGLTKLDPENRAALLGLLRVYDQGHQFDKAAPILESFLKLQPGNLALKTQYGGLLLRGRRFGEARKILEEVLATDPGNREALRLEAALLSETREPEKADEMLRKLQVLEPDDMDIPYRRAVNFLEAHRIPEAEKVLEDMRSSLAAKKPDGPEIAQIDGQLAYAAYLRKDYAAAVARLTPRLRDEDGLNLQAYNLLLQIARDREDWPEGLRIAKEAYETATRKTPLLRASYGEFLIRSASAAEQAEGAKMLDELAAEDRTGTLAAADAWQRLDKYGRAAAAARQGLERDKEDPDLLFRLAASLEREKKVTESVDAFEKLLKVRADHAPGLNYLGYMWADRGENLPRALELIRKAVALDPGNGAYLDSLGWVYFQLNKLDQAEENLRAASALNPDDATVEEHLGDLLEKKGDVGRARESWKRALTLKPEDDEKHRLDEKLKKTDTKK
jgi:tetratricopeptide (TPR) repeat protein